MKKYLFFFFGLLAPLVFADESGKFECNIEKNYNFENVTIDVRDNCSLSVDPAWGMETEGRKRSYTFTKDGYFMVFLSTKDDERLSRSTGSNSYHLRSETKLENTLEYNFNESLHLLTLTTASGVQVEVDTRGAQILNIEGYRLTTRPLSHISDLVKNNGNVELSAYDKNIVFDHGFRLGEISITQLWREAFVSLGTSKKCKIKNSDVLKKDPNDAGEVIFTIDNYQDALSFYNKKC